MSGDLKAVVLVLFMVSMFAVWNFFYASAQTDVNNFDYGNTSGTNIQETTSWNFFTVLKNIVQLNTDYPEIFFVNIIFFTTLAGMVVLIGLRYVRGQ